MYCFQCQEAAKNIACTTVGVCGKQNDTSNLQDLLVHNLKGISVIATAGKEAGVAVPREVGLFVAQALFTTITNANFNDENIIEWILQAQKVKKELFESVKDKTGTDFHESATWYSDDTSTFAAVGDTVGILTTENVDVRSLRELLIIGIKGIAAYADHAAMLGLEKDEIYDFFFEALASTTQDLSVDQMVGLVLKAGEVAVTTMATLDEANTTAFGHPEITEVNLGVGSKPGILISGHDLKDMEELLEQTKDSGVDVYTHCEMLPANSYPAFKKYDHLIGNYGGAWWKQNDEFESFNGPVLMTTNCIVPPKKKNTYINRLFTTGVASQVGAKHIGDREKGGSKDFSALIEAAKSCAAPIEIETGKLIAGFAHNQVISLADKVVDAVKSGAIKRFIVMAGCDGRHKSRNYFTEVAENLPKDAVILTAGCAKYRYNKLNLGDIGGIPRVLDAGQCNDSYSLVVIALKLKEAFGLDSINDLPISFDLGWYEQKAVTVLLALLHLGVQGIRVGPTLPAFISPTVLNVLIENFNIKLITDPDSDIKAMMAGN
jgi:hydroxylamine reductase